MTSHDIVPSAVGHPARQTGRRRLNGLIRRVAAGADLLVATQRMDIARMLVSWNDLRRG